MKSLTPARRNLLRLVAECPLIRDLSPSKDEDMLWLVDEGLVTGNVGWLEGERVWTYRATAYGLDVAAEPQAGEVRWPLQASTSGLKIERWIKVGRPTTTRLEGEEPLDMIEEMEIENEAKGKG